ncbi:Mak10 subunit [Thozetella sp. PMI_491]|nr:Mak10 subunit [Thozetella sp. PMI_491]
MAQDEAAVSQELGGLSITPDAQPPAPRISSEGIIATDITERFKDAAATLQPGELVKDDYFTLFESVGALEIMDPKMDSGCLALGESLDVDFDVTRPILPKEVLGIIDQLLCLEMAWHLGYPLSQTLLTNVYIEAMMNPAPETLADADFIRNRKESDPRDPMLTVLRAYILGLLKACWYVNERIKYEHYYEEEDFVTNNYHRTLLENIDHNDIRDEILEARRMLGSIQHKISDELSNALSYRLEFRTAFLRAIELSELRSEPESLKLPWRQMQVVWDQIKLGHDLGVPVPEAFSTKIQRRLASTVPPRPIVQLSFDEAWDHFKKLVDDAIEVLDVLYYSDSQSLMTFVLTFQAKKPQPLVYIRTLLQSFLFRDMIILGHLSIRQVMDDDLAITVLPGSRLLDPSNDAVEAPHDPRFAMAHQMEIFRQRAAQSYFDILRAFCQNRCRVRRTLCHSIQDWETVQVDAEEIDQLLQIQLEEQPIQYPTVAPAGMEPVYSLPLSSWAYLYKLRLMEWIVQLGFELETYQPDELAGMYWYLSYLAKTRAQHAERIKAFNLHARADLRRRCLEEATPYTASMDAQFRRALDYLRLMVLDAAVTWELADALSCLYTVLYRERAIEPPPRPYSTDSLRYDIRMRPFAPIGLPELPSFAAFERATKQPDSPTASLLDYAERAVAGAKRGFEVLGKFSDKEAFAVRAHDRWLSGTKNGLRSAIAAGIAVSTLQKALAGADTAEGKNEGRGKEWKVEIPKPEKAFHEWWVVPKITIR